MRTQNPTTRTLKISEVKSQFSSLVDAVYHHETRVLIEKSGIPVAAIVSTADLSRLSQFDREREELFEAIDRMREAFKDVPAEEIEEETDRIIARNRAADRAAREEARHRPARARPARC